MRTGRDRPWYWVILVVSVLSAPAPGVAQDGNATIVIMKEAGGVTTTRFGFSLQGLAVEESFELGHREQVSFDVSPGLVTITEEVPEGWVLNAIQCFGLAFVPGPVASGAVQLDLAPDQSATCRFFNQSDSVPPRPAPPSVEIPMLSARGTILLALILAGAGAWFQWRAR